MPLSPTFKNPTGKQNLLGSVNVWLEQNIPSSGPTDFSYQFTAQLAPTVFPRVEVKEFQYFDRGSVAFGNVLFPTNPQGKVEGMLAQTMIEFNLLDDVVSHIGAKKKIYELRDKFVYGLRHAGRTRDTDEIPMLPPIIVRDYNGGTAADTNIVAWVPAEEDNHLIERYFEPSPEAPNIHRIQLLFKIYWYELVPF